MKNVESSQECAGTVSPKYRGPRTAVRILACLMGVWGSLFAAMTSALAGPPLVSQYVVAKAPVLDEYGVKLRGNSLDAELFGHDHVPGEIVQILLATDGIIHPPSVDGTPHANNPVLKEVKIGWGVSPALGWSGMFATGVVRPDHGAKIFARVFNRASLADATFYGNSQLYTVNNTQFEVFEADVPATTLPLDSGDDDGDGIINSWERSYAQDTDGDGISNGAEYAAGSDMLSAESAPAFDLVAITENGMLRFQWPAKSGTTYVVEEMPATADSAPTRLATVQATSDRGEADVPLDLLDRMACVRLSVVYQ